MQYSLLLHSEEATAADMPAEDWAAAEAAFDAYGKSLDAAGILVSADILQPAAVSTTVTLKNGELQVQDGPFADTKEKLGGTFVINVPDLDAAIAWAEKCPGAQYGVIEIRPSAIVFRDGQWQRTV